MTGEDDGAPPPPPPPPQESNTELEQQQTEQLKTNDHSEEDTKQIEYNDEEEEEDEHHSPPSSPPLLDLIEFPPQSTLPPTPPLPSSPRDTDMEQQDSDEDDGPPPGWDNNYQVKEQEAEQVVTPAVSSDIQTEDVRQDAPNEEVEPGSHTHPSLPLEVDPSVEQQDSEDEGPPPGWDSKCQPEPESQKISDMQMEDVLQNADTEKIQPTPEVPSVCENTDMLVDREDSGDEGPPPGWDSKCRPETEVQKTPQSDLKTNYVQQDSHNENSSPQSQSQSQLQSQSCSSPAPEPVPLDINMEEQDSGDDGPPPGWNSKCQLEPNLQTTCPITPPSDLKIEEDKEDTLDKVSSPAPCGSTPQQHSYVQSSLPSPIVQAEVTCGHSGQEPNNVKVIEESPQPPSRQQPIHPTKPQVTVPKPPTTMNNPEMGQMVCGSCRHLLSYPRGARYVECACCLEENYVLEEHEVGQVVCGSCDVLLMYPYGAPKVRCANCKKETEIGDQNRRPPLSEHKRRARQHLKRVHAG